MLRGGYPGARVCGTAICGRGPAPIRGLPHAERLRAVTGAAGAALLEWDEYVLAGAVTTLGLTRHIYVGGELTRRTLAQRSAPLSAVRLDAQTRVDLLALSRTEASAWGETELFAWDTVGGRIRLDWSPVPTASDFAGTVIYWDAGLGATPGTEVARVHGVDQTTWVSDELSDGVSYRFSIGFFDHLGNVSTSGAPVAVCRVERAPLAPVDVTVSYTSGTRVATLSWSQPAGQHADVVGVVISDNYLVGAGFSEAVNSARALRRAFVPLGTSTWSSMPLFCDAMPAQREWVFSVRAVDRRGHESSPAEVRLSLSATSGQVVRLAPRPARPTSCDAWPIAGARAVVTWEHGEEYTDSFRIYSGAAVLATAPTTGSSVHTYTTATLTHGATYVFSVAAVGAGGESERSDTATVVADGRGPSAAASLTAELIG